MGKFILKVGKKMVLYVDLDESLLLEIVAIADLEQIVSTPVLSTEVEPTNSEMVTGIVKDAWQQYTNVYHTGIFTCCSTDDSQRRALLQDVYVALCGIVVAVVAFHMMASDESDFTVCHSTVVEKNSASQVTGCCSCYPAIDNSVPRLVTGMKPWSFGNLPTRHAQETNSNTTCAQIVHGTLVYSRII